MIEKNHENPQSGWSAPGFEPRTSRMRVSCVTTEPPRSVLCYSMRRFNQQDYVIILCLYFIESGIQINYTLPIALKICMYIIFFIYRVCLNSHYKLWGLVVGTKMVKFCVVPAMRLVRRNGNSMEDVVTRALYLRLRLRFASLILIWSSKKAIEQLPLKGHGPTLQRKTLATQGCGRAVKFCLRTALNLRLD